MKNKQRSKLALIILVIGIGFSVWLFIRGVKRPNYAIIDLPVPDGSVFGVRSINDNGQVAGCFKWSSGEYGGYIWDEENGVEKLPEIPGKSFLILDINNKGQTVGTIFDKGTGDNKGSVGLFRDIDGMITRLPYEDGTRTIAFSINNKGDVAGVISWGQREEENVVKRVFVWNKTSGMRVIDGIEGKGILLAGINDAGQIAGKGLMTGGQGGFIWSEKTGVVLLDERVSRVFDINENGDVLGRTQKPADKFFVWNKSKGFRVLGVEGDLMGGAQMNDRGDVVGYVTEADVNFFGYLHIRDARDIPFLLNSDGKPIKLNRLFEKHEFFHSIDINNSGWIVGNIYDDSNDEYRTVLLRPE